MSHYNKVRAEIEAKHREIRELEARLTYSDGERVIARMLDQNVMFMNVVVNNKDLLGLAQWLRSVYYDRVKRKKEILKQADVE